MDGPTCARSKRRSIESRRLDPAILGRDVDGMDRMGREHAPRVRGLLDPCGLSTRSQSAHQMRDLPEKPPLGNLGSGEEESCSRDARHLGARLHGRTRSPWALDREGSSLSSRCRRGKNRRAVCRSALTPRRPSTACFSVLGNNGLYDVQKGRSVFFVRLQVGTFRPFVPGVDEDESRSSTVSLFV